MSVVRCRRSVIRLQGGSSVRRTIDCRKARIALVAALSVGFLQARLERAEERLEKARQISDIAVDWPLATVSQLPAHIDAYITYAAHVRAGDVPDGSSTRVTELEAAIRADLEGSRAFFANDVPLQKAADGIRDDIARNKAKILTKRMLSADDVAALERVRIHAYQFHDRIVALAISRTFSHFDAAYNRKASVWRRLFG